VFRTGIENGPIGNATIDRDLINIYLLEANLNAALWNNTYQRVGVFQMQSGLKYRIGPIGQTTRGTHKLRFLDQGIHRHRSAPFEAALTHSSSDDFTSPIKVLLQVMLDVSGHSKNVSGYLARVLTLLAEHPVIGRERYLGDRPTHPRQ
jgi:hypothetical protein